MRDTQDNNLLPPDLQEPLRLLGWVDWFNNRRLLEPIGHVPPAEAEAAYYAALEEPAALAA